MANPQDLEKEAQQKHDAAEAEKKRMIDEADKKSREADKLNKEASDKRTEAGERRGFFDL